MTTRHSPQLFIEKERGFLFSVTEIFIFVSSKLENIHPFLFNIVGSTGGPAAGTLQRNDLWQGRRVTEMHDTECSLVGAT